MSSHCDHEPVILAALDEGPLSEELDRHLATCDVCAEAALVCRYLREPMGDEAEPSTMPSAGLIWWRAQLEEQRNLANRSVASIRIVQKVTALVAAAVAVLMASAYSTQVFTGTSALLAVGIVSLPAVSVSALAVLYYWARAAK